MRRQMDLPRRRQSTPISGMPELRTRPWNITFLADKLDDYSSDQFGFSQLRPGEMDFPEGRYR